MTDSEKLAALIIELKELAAAATRYELYGSEYSPSEYENNAEDAYGAGVEDGATRLARDLLATLNA